MNGWEWVTLTAWHIWSPRLMSEPCLKKPEARSWSPWLQSKTLHWEQTEILGGTKICEHFQWWDVVYVGKQLTSSYLKVNFAQVSPWVHDGTLKERLGMEGATGYTKVETEIMTNTIRDPSGLFLILLSNWTLRLYVHWFISPYLGKGIQLIITETHLGQPLPDLIKE